METKIVINDGKTGKSYQKVVDGNKLLGKKIGETVKGKSIDFGDYDFVITGGSDSSGFPMRSDLDGTLRKKIFITKSVGLRDSKGKGYRKKKSVAGNIITEKTAQINVKISKYGAKKVEEIFGSGEPKKEEVKEEKNS